MKNKNLLLVLSIFVVIRVFLITLNQTVFANTPWMSHMNVDLWGWLEFFKKSHEGLIPYVDYSKEYPVGAGLLYWIMSFFITPGTHQSVPLVHAVFMFVAECVNVILFFKIAELLFPKRIIAAVFLFALNFTALILNPVRYESYVTLTVLAGFLCHINKKPRLATFWWALGCTMKWYPLFFIAARELQRLFRCNEINLSKKLKSLESFKPIINSAMITVAVLALVNVPFILISLSKFGHFDQWWNTYSFHLNRPLYWDTLLGVGQMWFGVFDFEIYASYWTLIFVLHALLLRPAMSVEAKGTLICIAAIILNRVYSTQFHLWFYPFLIIFAAQIKEAETTKHENINLKVNLNVVSSIFNQNKIWHKFIFAFVVLDLLNIFIYPFSFTYALIEMKGFRLYSANPNGGIWTTLFSLAILIRTFVLGWFVWAIYKFSNANPGSGNGEKTERSKLMKEVDKN